MVFLEGSSRGVLGSSGEFELPFFLEFSGGGGPCVYLSKGGCGSSLFRIFGGWGYGRRYTLLRILGRWDGAGRGSWGRWDGARRGRGAGMVRVDPPTPLFSGKEKGSSGCSLTLFAFRGGEFGGLQGSSGEF